MKIALDVVDMFGKDVRHLHGNLFRVRRSRIRLARAGLDVKDGRLVYGNPRWFLNKQGSPEARGLESSKMEELKSSIQKSGLDNPIRLRPVDQGEFFLEVVNGERRFRCIESLCESGDDCYDSAVGDKAPASKVYEWVDCRIEEMDDRDALGVALKTNETSEVIGDLASIQVVKILRKAGYDDQDILVATGKSLSWLRETDRIIGLDDVCLEHFESEQITRKAALQLALIENIEERISILERVVDVARKRHESKMTDLERKLKDAESSELVAASAAKVASDLGDEDQAEELEQVSKKAGEKARKIREERDKACSRGAKADVRDLKQTSSSRSASAKPVAGVGSDYIEAIEAIIASEGFDEDGDSYGLDLSLLTVVCGVLKAVLDGEKDIMSVLSDHCSLALEEDILEDESDEDESDEDESDEDESDEDESDEDESDEDESDEDESDEDESDEEDFYEDETPPELEREFIAASDEDEDDY